jgi:hypothetical protein
MASPSRSWRLRASGGLLIALLGARVVREGHAAPLNQAPTESRAQVAAALEAIAAAFRGHERRLASGAPGTIERAIAAYVPGVFRPVQEGAIAPARSGARCPPEMALVFGRVCVDRYEASVVERASDGTLLAHAPNQSLAAGNAYVARSVGADTQARGWGPLELNDPRNIELDGTLGKTGAFPDCVNDFGLYDMVGNLHEWTADPNGTFQGGYWLDTSLHGDGCAYRTIAHPFDYRDYSIGFRCCADPEEAPRPQSGTQARP